MVRGADAKALLRPIRQLVHGLDSQLTIRRLRPLSDLVDEARGTPRFVTALGSLFPLQPGPCGGGGGREAERRADLARRAAAAPRGGATRLLGAGPARSAGRSHGRA